VQRWSSNEQMKHVLVRWDGDPIGVWTFDAARPLRVGADEDADIVLPIDETVIDGDGDTTVGRFELRVATTNVIKPRSPLRAGRAAASMGASAILHAALFAMLLASSTIAPRAPGADDATNLATMQGYLSRIADRGHGQVIAPPRPAQAAPAIPNGEPTPTKIKPAEQAPAPPKTRAHATTGGAGWGASGAKGVGSGAALQAGDDWKGTYLCSQGQTDLVLRVTSVNGSAVRAVFDFTHAPTGVHGSYRMHGRLDPTTGDASLVPDEWIEQPPNYVTVGMRGHVAGGNFVGTITHEECGSFALHHRAS
jgi:hypothetical protein